MSFIDYFAWFVFTFMAAIAVLAIAVLGMAPGYIARSRNHPWAQAVQVAGWATLIFGFVLWPIALVWAYVEVPRKEASK